MIATSTRSARAIRSSPMRGSIGLLEGARVSSRSKATRRGVDAGTMLLSGPSVREEGPARSEEHTSELQSLMRISYAVFCLNTKHKIHSQRKKQTHADNT